jgi:hypothetical protein
MTGYDALRCTKDFPHPDGDQATELLLIKHLYTDTWEVMPRCAAHPADDDIPLLRHFNPSLVCVVVPLKGDLSGPSSLSQKKG